ncbi:DUF1003 domain-containing protein [Variovorax paradoxus]|uniref:DUF1003 domain-containing protein n=1 Tax=Variovorax paradoxus TaxID=34073 RepID=UPI0029C686DF|nr:DUF1003 domain-containing protein [Variovorax paradoxus]WPH22482.1 DUF1003 domain-containing protein [Variovorax paradoxus]
MAAAEARPRAAGDEPRVAGVVDRNIAALVRRRQEQKVSSGLEDQVADAITRFAGSMKFVYLHLLVYGGWIVVNLGWVPGVRAFDPTFVVLAMVASVEAIFISTFVMISQNRMAAIADQRADLDLQISLLGEHEITKLVTLVAEIAKRMDIPAAEDPELDELSKNVSPERVLDRIERPSDEEG